MSCSFTREDALAISTARAAVRFDGGAAQIIRSSETPGAVGDDTHSEAERLCHRGAADFAILGGETAVTIVGQADVGVGCTEMIGDVECPVSDVLSWEIKFNTAP